MNTTPTSPENPYKATVLLLRHTPDETLPLAFLFARAGLATAIFDDEHELDNWLSHCVDATVPVLAALIDAGAFKRSRYRFDHQSALARRHIPLLIVDTTHRASIRDRFAAAEGAGLTIYRTTLDLLPRLLGQLKTLKLHGNDRPKEAPHE